VVRFLTFLVATATAAAAVYDLGRLQAAVEAGRVVGIGYGLLLSASAAAVAVLTSGAVNR
jgi:hypothetical protein